MLTNGNKKKILIVDDAKTNRKILEHILKKNNYASTSVTSGHDCIRAVLEQKPDLVLLDIMMPDISGIEVCRKLRSDSRIGPVPILFVTGATDDRTLADAFDAGGNDYIRKPVNKVELLKRIQATFEHARLLAKKKQQEELRNALAMSGTICHELNQPMQYISGTSQLLLMDLAQDSPIYQKIAKIKVQVDRMDDIIKKLTRLNRIDTRSYLGDTPMLSINK